MSLAKRRAFGLADFAREQLIELIDHDQKIRPDRPVVAALLARFGSDAVERLENRLGATFVGMGEQLGELRRRRVVARGHLRKRRQGALVLVIAGGIEQACGKRRHGSAFVLAGAHHRDAPEIDRRHHARRGEPWHETGQRQRGLARAAGADDEQERRLARPRILQRIDRLGDVARAAEEHGSMFGAERGQPAEGRALGVDRPEHRAAFEDLLLEPGPEQLLDLGLELVGALEGMEGELELAVLRLEPGLEEALQPVPLLADELVGGLVVELDGGRLAIAEHIDVGDGLGLARLDRREDLVGGARRVVLSVRHGGEIVGELGADPVAQDGNDQVAVGRPRGSAAGRWRALGNIGSPSGWPRAWPRRKTRRSGARRRARPACARNACRRARRRRREPISSRGSRAELEPARPTLA